MSSCCGQHVWPPPAPKPIAKSAGTHTCQQIYCQLPVGAEATSTPSTIFTVTQLQQFTSKILTLTLVALKRLHLPFVETKGFPRFWYLQFFFTVLLACNHVIESTLTWTHFSYSKWDRMRILEDLRVCPLWKKERPIVLVTHTPFCHQMHSDDCCYPCNCPLPAHSPHPVIGSRPFGPPDHWWRVPMEKLGTRHQAATAWPRTQPAGRQRCEHCSRGLGRPAEAAVLCSVGRSELPGCPYGFQVWLSVSAAHSHPYLSPRVMAHRHKIPTSCVLLVTLLNNPFRNPVSTAKLSCKSWSCWDTLSEYCMCFGKSYPFSETFLNGEILFCVIPSCPNMNLP